MNKLPNSPREEVKYLSDVLDYERDIAPFQLIQIYSGVGSGKNTWVQKLAQKGYSILFITSRKIIADIQAENMNAHRFIDLEELYKCTWNAMPSKNKQYLVSCTNASIARYAESKYDSKDKSTHIWNLFDFVILDEAHSVVSDASFSSASFHVWRFILWVTKQRPECKVILMSGTPIPLDGLIPAATEKDRRYHRLDLYDKCNHVDPKQVIIHRGEDMAIGELLGFYKERKRLIYFANRITHMEKIVEQLQKHGVPEQAIGVSYSLNEKNKNRKFPEAIKERINDIDQSIQKDGSIPSEIKIFLTTTKNKEGININDDDIKVMIAESRQCSELIQMAGRVRKGLDCLIILANRQSYYSSESNGLEPWYWERDGALLGELTTIFTKYTQEHNWPTAKAIIEDTEKNFPYIKYDYFQQKLALFRGKKLGVELADDEDAQFQECVQEWFTYCADMPPQLGTLGAVQFKQMFPHSEVAITHIGLHDRLISPEEKAQQAVSDYLTTNGYLNRVITKEERDTILKELNAELGKINALYKEQMQFGRLLKKYGYILKTVGSHKNPSFCIEILDMGGGEN